MTSCFCPLWCSSCHSSGKLNLFGYSTRLGRAGGEGEYNENVKGELSGNDKWMPRVGVTEAPQPSREMIISTVTNPTQSRHLPLSKKTSKQGTGENDRLSTYSFAMKHGKTRQLAQVKDDAGFTPALLAYSSILGHPSWSKLCLLGLQLPLLWMVITAVCIKTQRNSTTNE